MLRRSFRCRDFSCTCICQVSAFKAFLRTREGKNLFKDFATIKSKSGLNLPKSGRNSNKSHRTQNPVSPLGHFVSSRMENEEWVSTQATQDWSLSESSWYTVIFFNFLFILLCLYSSIFYPNICLRITSNPFSCGPTCKLSDNKTLGNFIFKYSFH